MLLREFRVGSFGRVVREMGWHSGGGEGIGRWSAFHTPSFSLLDSAKQPHRNAHCVRYTEGRGERTPVIQPRVHSQTNCRGLEGMSMCGYLAAGKCNARHDRMRNGNGAAENQSQPKGICSIPEHYLFFLQYSVGMSGVYLK